MTGRKACYRWRDGACKFSNSCRNAHFRLTWEPDNTSPSTTSRPERPQQPSCTSQRQWPSLPSRSGDSQNVPSQCSAPSQPTGNTTSPAVAQPSPQDGVASTSAPDREAWVAMVARILPLIVPQERSGTKREQMAGMRDGFNLLATRHAELPPHRQVPAINPTGTCMPSASSGSIMAVAAKAASQPINTNQPQSETQVYPFSQCKQVVTESSTPEDQEASNQVPTSNRPSWADMSMTEPDGDVNDPRRLRQLTTAKAAYLHPHLHSRCL